MRLVKDDWLLLLLLSVARLSMSPGLTFVLATLMVLAPPNVPAPAWESPGAGPIQMPLTSKADRPKLAALRARVELKLPAVLVPSAVGLNWKMSFLFPLKPGTEKLPSVVRYKLG